jgi:hypothetical protein
MLRVEILWTEQMPQSKGKVVTSHKQQLVTRTKEKKCAALPWHIVIDCRRKCPIRSFFLKLFNKQYSLERESDQARFQNDFLLKYSPDKTK